MSVLESPCHPHASPKDLVGLQEQNTYYNVVVPAMCGPLSLVVLTRRALQSGKRAGPQTIGGAL